MSLINDALRQASQAHKEQNGAAPPPPDPAWAPAATPVLNAAPLSPWPSLVKLMVLALVGLGLVGGGAFLVWKALPGRRAHPELMAKVGSPSRAAPASRPAPATQAKAPASNNVSSASTISAAGPSVATSAAPAIAATPPTNATTAAKVEARPPTEPKPAPASIAQAKWPVLRLQGIFYRPPESSVVINNKTLYLDDEIQGVKVAEIARNGVTLALNGQTNTLHLR